MNYFKNQLSRGIRDLYEIYDNVYKLTPYAKRLYGSNYEDILDLAIDHMIKNYNSEKGQIANYTIRLLKTIGKNRYIKEYAADEQVSISLEELSLKDFTEEFCLDEGKSSSFSECLGYLIKFFVYDYKFLVSGLSKYRKCNYKDLFNTYNYQVIKDTIKYLKDTYSEKVNLFYNYAKKPCTKEFSRDRYIQSLDKNLKFNSCINNIYIVTKTVGSHSKFIYKLDIKKVTEMVLKSFYIQDKGILNIEGVNFYLSLGGSIISNYDDLLFSIENSIIGSTLSRTGMKVVAYIENDFMLLSSTKDSDYCIVYDMFDEVLKFSLERVVSKEVVI